MTRMTGPDCVVMCNLINTHTHTHTQDQCEWHIMTRMTGPDCAIICNLINTHTHTWAGTGMEVETRGRTQDGNWDGSGDGNESSSGDGNGDGNEDEIGKGGGEAKSKKPHKRYGRHVRNGRDLGGKRKKRRQEKVSSVAASPELLLENGKEAVGEIHGTQGFNRNGTS